MNKSDFFVREGQRCNEVAFVLSGIFRSFYLSGKGEEITYCFKFPGEMIAAYSAFITGGGSAGNVQALMPAELLVIRKTDIEALIHTNTKWLMFSKIVAEQQYIHTIPLEYLASYLNITQRHLSRIRKEISA